MSPAAEPERFRRLKELFGQALERPPSPSGRRFSRRRRRGDAALAREVRALLDAHARDGGFVEEIVAAEARDLVAPEAAPRASRDAGSAPTS